MPVYQSHPQLKGMMITVYLLYLCNTLKGASLGYTYRTQAGRRVQLDGLGGTRYSFLRNTILSQAKYRRNEGPSDATSYPPLKVPYNVET